MLEEILSCRVDRVKAVVELVRGGNNVPHIQGGLAQGILLFRIAIGLPKFRGGKYGERI